MEKEVDLYTVLVVLSKNWLLILIVPLILVVATTVGLYLTSQPMYTASTTLLVLDSMDSEQGLVLDDKVTKRIYDTYARIVTSKRILNQVISDLKLDLTAEQLRKSTSVLYIGDSNIMEISVVGNDPDRSALIADQIARTYIFEIGSIMDGKQVSLLDEATVPRTPIQTSKVPKVVAVAAAGLLAAVGLVFIREFFLPAFKEQPEKVIE